MKRMVKFSAATAVAFALFTGTAYAHYCTNASKKDGAGNAGVLSLRVTFVPSPDPTKPDEPQFEVVGESTTVKLNRQGHVTGGFMDIHVDFVDERIPDFVLNDVYAHASLPGDALLAAGCGRATETNVPFFAEYCPPS